MDKKYIELFTEIAQTNNINERIKSYQIALNFFKSDLIPKLEYIIENEAFDNKIFDEKSES